MKMKNILNSLFPWLAMTTLLSLQGCENEEGTAIHSRDTVSFEIDAGGARATETTFETGDAIGVYAAVRYTLKGKLANRKNPLPLEKAA